MFVRVTLESSSGQLQETEYYAVPREVVDEIRHDHNAWLNEEQEGPRSKSYSFERTDGGAARISLDFERVASIDSFEEDDA